MTTSHLIFREGVYRAIDNWLKQYVESDTPLYKFSSIPCGFEIRKESPQHELLIRFQDIDGWQIVYFDERLINMG